MVWDLDKQEALEKNDPPAREVVKKWLNKKGYVAKDHPDKYAVDLVISDEKGFTFFVEVQRQGVWQREQFPYNAVRIFQRKDRYKNYFEGKVFFFILSYDLTQAFIVDSEKAIQEKYLVKSNTQPNAYYIPVADCTYVFINH